MRANTSPHVQVKAAGGVRTLDALLDVMELGVTRIGATATETIILDFRARKAGEQPVGDQRAGSRSAGTDDAMTRRRATAADALAGFRDAPAVLDARRPATQADGIETASHWCADAIAADGLVHLFGTGHSRIPVEEMFPRYGSYPGFNPIVELSMTFHTQVVGANGQRQAMFIERDARPRRGHPVELPVRPARRDDRVLRERPDRRARGDGRRARRRAACGSSRSRPSPSRCPPSRSRPPGSGCSRSPTSCSTCAPRDADATVRIDGLDTPVGPCPPWARSRSSTPSRSGPPSSSWSAGRCRRSSPARARSGTERSRELFDEAYREHARRLARAIDQQGGG